jgi:broad specificity phosphatase PhoE
MLEHNEFYLTLVRHGQSEVNANPDRMGQAPTVPLTTLGRTQAQKLNQRFRKERQLFNYIFSSPYTRALDTAKIAMGVEDPIDNSIILANDERIILADDLREYSAGDWTNASRSYTITSDVKLRMAGLDHTFLPPNGESLSQVERRVSLWVEDNIIYNKEMIEKSREYAPEGQVNNIVLFSHGMTIKCLLHHIMGFDKHLTWKVTIDNTSVSRLYFGKDGWRILSINDSAHLTLL